MKTVEIKIYHWDELSDKAKQTAIDSRRGVNDYYHIWEEARQTAEAFCKVFNVRTSINSWLELGSIDTEFDPQDMKGIRLRTWLFNNHFHDIYRGKYYGKLVSTFKNGKTIPVSNEHPIGRRIVQRRSKVMYEFGYPLTGVCYDYDILQSFVEFMEYSPNKSYPKGVNPIYYAYSTWENTDLEDLVNEAFNNLRHSIESEIEWRESDVGIMEEITDDLWFTEDGIEYTE